MDLSSEELRDLGEELLESSIHSPVSPIIMSPVAEKVYVPIIEPELDPVEPSPKYLKEK